MDTLLFSCKVHFSILILNLDEFHATFPLLSFMTAPDLVTVIDNYLFDVIFLHCLCGNIDSILLHLLRHVRIFNDGLSVTAHFAV